jgi:hypothetical protein
LYPLVSSVHCSNRITQYVLNINIEKKYVTTVVPFCNENIALQEREVRVIVFNATFNNISVISWQSVL